MTFVESKKSVLADLIALFGTRWEFKNLLSNQTSIGVLICAFSKRVRIFMGGIDERQQAMEAKLHHDSELRFKANARRNKSSASSFRP